jgi:fucose 4-O-acetylase-like acetyltransferase
VRRLKPEHAAGTPARLAWVDVARGIGIVLVVYGHALRAQISSGHVDPAWHASIQDRTIYAFHMQLFFFLAGLFVERAVARGAVRFANDKAWTIIYPYFLWSIVSITLAAAAGPATNTAMDLGRVATIWREPVYQYWFLYVLLICNLVAFLTRADWRIAILLIVAAIAGMADFFPYMPGVAVGFFPFFFAGLILRPRLVDRPVSVGAAVVALVGGGLGFVAITAGAGSLGWLPERVFQLLAATLGVVAVVGGAILLGHRAKVLAWLGTVSMAIFLLHTLFSAGLRMALVRLGMTSPPGLLITCTLIGFVGPVIVLLVARRFGIVRAAGLGSEDRPLRRVAA